MNLKPVVLSKSIIDLWLEIEKRHLESGEMAWGKPYSSSTWAQDYIKERGISSEYIKDGLYYIPVANNCLGQYLVLKYAKEEVHCQDLILPSNTFQGIRNFYYGCGLFSNIKTYLTTITGAIESASLENLESAYTSRSCTVTTPIGGYSDAILTGNPIDGFILVDGAHCHFLDYESALPATNSALVYSFFATKNVNIGGEGGMIVTKDANLYNWLLRALNYDKPLFTGFGFNARLKQADCYKIIEGFANPECVEYFLYNRKEMFQAYSEVCDELQVEYIPSENNVNGYKFIIIDARVKDLGALTSSKVFEGAGHHVCPATYSQMAYEGETFTGLLKETLEKNLEA